MRWGGRETIIKGLIQNLYGCLSELKKTITSREGADDNVALEGLIEEIFDEATGGEFEAYKREKDLKVVGRVLEKTYLAKSTLMKYASPVS